MEIDLGQLKATERNIGQQYITDADVIDVELRELEMEFGFRLVGSRGVFGDLNVAPDTDYDYIAEDRPAVRHLLDLSGWDLVTQDTWYMDMASTAIYKKSIGGKLFPIQVVLKKPEYMPLVNKFWDLMFANQGYFQRQFWKSYVGGFGEHPNTRELIQERINNLLVDVLPYVKVTHFTRDTL